MGTHGPMKQGRVMKRGFLVLHDYGMGGIWAYVLAGSEDRVRREFPDLEVYSDPPSWMTQELLTHIKERSTLDLDQMDEEEDLLRILKGQL